MAGGGDTGGGDDAGGRRRGVSGGAGAGGAGAEACPTEILMSHRRAKVSFIICRTRHWPGHVVDDAGEPWMEPRAPPSARSGRRIR